MFTLFVVCLVVFLGLTMLCIFKGNIILIIFFATLFTISFFVPLFPSDNNSPISEYPYTTEVTLAGSDFKSDINFSIFTQAGNEIIIDKYTTSSRHWVDFKTYDVHEGLRIKLLDNDNKFIYTERATGETFNDMNFATQ